MVLEGDLLWQPSAERVARSRMTAFLDRHGFASYDDCWQWSIAQPGRFWAALAADFDVRWHAAPGEPLAVDSMPGAVWFPGGTLNYAEHALRAPGGVVFACEDGRAVELTADELRARVASVAAGLRELGVGRGDRVAALLPNCPEAVVGFLATASIGATWSSCSPDFGATGVADRFTQITPTARIKVHSL